MILIKNFYFLIFLKSIISQPFLLFVTSEYFIIITVFIGISKLVLHSNDDVTGGRFYFFEKRDLKYALYSTVRSYYPAFVSAFAGYLLTYPVIDGASTS